VVAYTLCIMYDLDYILISITLLALASSVFLLLKYRKMKSNFFIADQEAIQYKLRVKDLVSESELQSNKITDLETKDKERKPDIDAQEMLHNMFNTGAILQISVIDPSSVLFHHRR